MRSSGTAYDSTQVDGHRREYACLHGHSLNLKKQWDTELRGGEQNAETKHKREGQKVGGKEGEKRKGTKD